MFIRVTLGGSDIRPVFEDCPLMVPLFMQFKHRIVMLLGALCLLVRNARLRAEFSMRDVCLIASAARRQVLGEARRAKYCSE